MRKPERIYAIAGALLFHLVVLVVFVSTFLTYPPAGVEEWPPQKPHDIMLEKVEDIYASGEFVKTGTILKNSSPLTNRGPRVVPTRVRTRMAGVWKMP